MRVLIVRLSHLGDVVQTLPLVHALRGAIEDLELGWAVQPAFAPLVAPFARTFTFDRDGGWRAWVSLRRELRAFAPELVLDAQGNLKSAVATRITGAPRRVGFAPEDWREPFHRLALHESACPSPGPHLVERVWNLAQHVVDGLGDEVPLDPLLNEEELAAGRAQLSERSPGRGAPLWILHPGRPGDRRSWPAEGFRALAERLLHEGQDVLFLTGPSEASVGERLAREMKAHPGLAHWIDQRGLRQLAAVFAAARDQAARLVVGDSGPAHLAASVGLPVRLLVGPTIPRRTGPWPTEGGPHRLVLEPPAPFDPEAAAGLDCGWRPRAITDLDPDAVANDLLRELRGPR